jgi:hypothetical protein
MYINNAMSNQMHTPYVSSRKTWLEAGKKARSSIVTAGDPPVIELKGEHYSIIKGYCVPNYGDKPTTSSTKRASVLDQKKRFFYFAEPGIDVVDSHEDIMADYAQWQKTTHHDEKIALGALVVGAMVNRTARVEQALLMNRAGGLGLEDVVDSNNDIKPDEEKALKSQLREYSKMLLQNPALVSCVRREDYRKDRDGVLADIIRETFKAYLSDNEFVTRGITEKIGECMEAIDETSKISHEIFSAFTKYRQLNEFMNNNGRFLSDTFDAFVESARARTGIKSSDKHYSEIHTEFSIIGQKLFDQLSEIREKARNYDGQGDTVLLTGLKLLSNGAKLVDSMSKARYPYNKSAFPDVKREDRDPTSIELFQEKVESFKERSNNKHRTRSGSARNL